MNTIVIIKQKMTEYKCSRCQCVKDETEYKKNKKNQRMKLCIKCSDYRDKWNEKENKI